MLNITGYDPYCLPQMRFRAAYVAMHFGRCTI